jgi:hypothetical protein
MQVHNPARPGAFCICGDDHSSKDGWNLDKDSARLVRIEQLPCHPRLFEIAQGQEKGKLFEATRFNRPEFQGGGKRTRDILRTCAVADPDDKNSFAHGATITANAKAYARAAACESREMS